jgi:uncharacterized membrane protein HdeD (DUF308 family)
VLNVICRRWWVLFLRGLVAILFGIATMAWPGITLLYLVFLFAAFCIVDGIIGVALGVRGESDGTVWWTMVLLGSLTVVAGIISFAWPGLALAGLAGIVAAYAIVRGVFEISAAIRLRREIDDEWVLAFAGVLSIVFGILILARPGAGLLAIALLIGAYVMVLGVLNVALSLRLRKMGKSLSAQAS